MAGAYHSFRVDGWRIDVERGFLTHAREHGFLQPATWIREPGGELLEVSPTRRVSRHHLRFPAPARSVLLVVFTRSILGPGSIGPASPTFHGAGLEDSPILPLLWRAQGPGLGAFRTSAVALDAAEARSLDDLLRDPDLGEGDRREILLEASNAVARWLARGMRAAPLRSWLLFRRETASPDSRWAMASPFARVPAGSDVGARDIAELDASLPPGSLPPRDRLRALRTIARAGVSDPARRRAFRARVVRAASRGAARRRILREGLFSFDRLDTRRGRLLFDRDWRDLLQRAGLLDVESGLAFRGGELLRSLPDRENLRVSVAGFRSGEATLFMKRYPRDPLRRRVADLLLLRDRTSRARREWENLLVLRSLGIGTADPVAMGERVRGGRGASFVLTRAIDGAVPLDDWLRGRYPPAFPERRVDRRKRGWIRGLARIARTLHRAGGYHRDLYLCHLLVRERGDGLDFHLIDLDRVRWRRWVRSRWFVKDIAALDISAQRDWFTCTDRVRFLEFYLGCGAGDARLRGFLRRVRRKAARMRAHVPRHRIDPGEAR